MCDDCETTHLAFNPDSPSFECRALGTTVECNLGYYFDVSKKVCDVCKEGSYADGVKPDGFTSDNKLRTACRKCPDIANVDEDGKVLYMGQTSRVAATSVDDCFPKYQKANDGDSFCFGRGTVGQLNASSEAAAEASKLALVQLEEDGDDSVLGAVCETALLGLGFDYKGVIYPPRGCFLNTETNEGAYYVREKDYGTPKLENAITATDDKLAPICERYKCESKAGIGDEDLESTFLTENNSPDDELQCRASASAVNAAVAEEKDTNSKLFFPPVIVLILALAFCGYVYFVKYHYDKEKPFDELPKSVHYMIWWGFSLRSFDVATDWGFFAISLQSLAFQAACDAAAAADGSESAAKSMRSGCLAFAIIGTLLGPLDIWGAFQRMINKEHAVAGWIVLLVSVMEDLPQLVFNAKYISIMYRYQQMMLAEGSTTTVQPFDAISMFSLAASVANLCFNIALMISTVAVRKYQLKVTMLEAELAEYKGRVVTNPVYGNC